MSKSTLPDLFRADLNQIKFHHEDRPQKIGGRFSIKLNKEVPESLQKSPCRLRQGQSSTAYTKSIYSGQNRFRSQSINNIQPASKQEPLFENSVIKCEKSAYSGFNSRKKSQSLIVRQASTLQQIYYKNIMRNKLSTFKQIQIGFPYQTTKSANNVKTYMQQADSINNRVQNLLIIHCSCQRAFQQMKIQTSNINREIKSNKLHFSTDIQQFNNVFLRQCQSLMKKLSQLRRQTNEQTKTIAGDSQKLYYEYKDSGSILKILQTRSNALRNQCLQDKKLMLTNSKTYSYQINNEAYQSQKQKQQDKLFRINRKSGTSQEMRRRNSMVKPSHEKGQRLYTTSNKKNVDLKNLQNGCPVQKQPQNLFKQTKQNQNYDEFQDPLSGNKPYPKRFILNDQQTQFQDF